MKKITLSTDTRKSIILVGEKLKNLDDYLPTGKVIVITDQHINKLYNHAFSSFPVIEIGLGESNKTLETLSLIFEKLIEYEADRNTFIVAIGGGIVCDVAGFAASVFMRGLRYGFVSTSLLSQVDASVGGKNGVNFQRYKNMIGVFNQPEFVMIDIEMLDTLDDREFRSGFAEIIKAAAIRDEQLFSYLEMNHQRALLKDASVLEHLIYESVMIKARVVEADEKEKGERKILNFGHTFAHAIEHLTDILHGEAVSIGMVMAADYAVQLGLLNQSARDRLAQLLTNFQLPVRIELNHKDMVSAMKKDKKRQNDQMNMIFLDRIGNALIKPIYIKDLENKPYDLR
jgi:3-dehydroquinate synthase